MISFTSTKVPIVMITSITFQMQELLDDARGLKISKDVALQRFNSIDIVARSALGNLTLQEEVGYRVLRARYLGTALMECFGQEYLQKITSQLPDNENVRHLVEMGVDEEWCKDARDFLANPPSRITSVHRNLAVHLARRGKVDLALQVIDMQKSQQDHRVYRIRVSISLAVLGHFQEAFDVISKVRSRTRLQFLLPIFRALIVGNKHNSILKMIDCAPDQCTQDYCTMWAAVSYAEADQINMMFDFIGKVVDSAVVLLFLLRIVIFLKREICMTVLTDFYTVKTKDAAHVIEDVIAGKLPIATSLIGTLICLEHTDEVL